MLEKPIPPKKEKAGVFPYVTGMIMFLFISFFVVSYAGMAKERDWYESDLDEYNRIVENHSNEVEKYNKEVLSFIRSISPNYDIDNAGTIPVIVTVDCRKDKNSQYIGDEISYYFSKRSCPSVCR